MNASIKKVFNVQLHTSQLVHDDRFLQSVLKQVNNVLIRNDQ